jgi:hypothetical protein
MVPVVTRSQTDPEDTIFIHGNNGQPMPVVRLTKATIDDISIVVDEDGSLVPKMLARNPILEPSFDWVDGKAPNSWTDTGISDVEKETEALSFAMKTSHFPEKEPGAPPPGSGVSSFSSSSLIAMQSFLLLLKKERKCPNREPLHR